MESKTDSRQAADARGKYSVTGLMVYEECPRQYFATFVEGRPPPVTPAMRRGANVHALIAQHLRQPALFTAQSDTHVARLLDTFLASRFNIPPVEIESPFVLPFDRGDVHGRIDLVLPAGDGGLELVDLKSGSARGRRSDMERSLQLPLYTMAIAARHTLSLDRLAYTYFFLADNAEISFQPTEASFNALTNRVERIMHAVEEGRFEPRRGCRCHACRGEFGFRRRRPAARV